MLHDIKSNPISVAKINAPNLRWVVTNANDELKKLEILKVQSIRKFVLAFITTVAKPYKALKDGFQLSDISVAFQMIGSIKELLLLYPEAEAEVKSGLSQAEINDVFSLIAAATAVHFNIKFTTEKKHGIEKTLEIIESLKSIVNNTKIGLSNGIGIEDIPLGVEFILFVYKMYRNSKDIVQEVSEIDAKEFTTLVGVIAVALFDLLGVTNDK